MTDIVRKRKFTMPVEETVKEAVASAKKKAQKVKAPTPEVKPDLSAAPAVHIPKKTADAIVNRFAALLPDIAGITDKIIKADLDHTQAIEVTQRTDDLVDWAPNVLSWCSDPRFIGVRPFAKQAEVLIALFEEHCLRCSDLEYIADIPVGDTVEQITTKVAMMNFGVCPHCGFRKGDGRKKRQLKDPTEFIGVFGQRSGKTALASFGISYLLHKNLMLPSPWKTYHLTPGQVIDFTIVATTVGQADKTLWAALKGMIDNAPWFSTYREVCNEEGRRHGVRDTVKMAETFMWFGHKSIMLYFASNNPNALRGTTRFGAAIDELGWFADAEPGSTKVRANGPETYRSLNNACATLRLYVDEAMQKDPYSLLPMPMLFATSSPRAMNDAIMTLYREQAENKRAIRRHWASWEVNPKNSYAALERLGETKKPGFACDYGAQPPLTDDPLIPRTHIITDAFKTALATDKKYGPLLLPTLGGYVDDLDVRSGKHVTSYLTAGLDTDYAKPDRERLKALNPRAIEALGPLGDVFKDLMAKSAQNRPHVMGVDLGHTNNAMAIVCGYLAGDGKKFVTDFALAVKPTESRSVNIADVYDELIVPLVERLNVVAVYYDKWSSLHHLQDLASKYGSMGPLNDRHERRMWLRELADEEQLPSFIADTYSLSMPDTLMLVARLEQGDCLFPAAEVGVMELMVNKTLDLRELPYANLALQMATVRARGARLLKPVNGDDDLFRAWANAAVKAFTDELCIELLGQEGRALQKPAASTVVRSHVSLGMAGKGIRQVGQMSAGTVSKSGSGACPVVVRKGSFRG